MATVGHWIDREFEKIPVEDLEASDRLMEIDVAGFGLVLMRASALKLLEGTNPFHPKLGPAYGHWQLTGEDISFCLNLKERGGKIMVDPRVRVEHLKTMPVRYVRHEATILPEAGQLTTKG